jgi:hypothetical protein
MYTSVLAQGAEDSTCDELSLKNSTFKVPHCSIRKMVLIIKLSKSLKLVDIKIAVLSK